MKNKNWLLLVVIAVVGYVLWSKHKATKAAADNNAWNAFQAGY
jgi:cbb3-type cytochrome oxidase subunit 3